MAYVLGVSAFLIYTIRAEISDNVLLSLIRFLFLCRAAVQHFMS